MTALPSPTQTASDLRKPFYPEPFYPEEVFQTYVERICGGLAVLIEQNEIIIKEIRQQRLGDSG
jgi:hypothetical protein